MEYRGKMVDVPQGFGLLIRKNTEIIKSEYYTFKKNDHLVIKRVSLNCSFDLKVQFEVKTKMYGLNERNRKIYET